jgi:hypothetical protein
MKTYPLTITSGAAESFTNHVFVGNLQNVSTSVYINVHSHYVLAALTHN